MAAYEYVCLACEHHFEERRSMTASVVTEPICPSCGAGRVRRRFSFVASKPASADLGSPRSGACGCGGACACGH